MRWQQRLIVIPRHPPGCCWWAAMLSAVASSPGAAALQIDGVYLPLHLFTCPVQSLAAGRWLPAAPHNDHQPCSKRRGNKVTPTAIKTATKRWTKNREQPTTLEENRDDAPEKLRDIRLLLGTSVFSILSEGRSMILHPLMRTLQKHLTLSHSQLWIRTWQQTATSFNCHLTAEITTCNPELILLTTKLVLANVTADKMDV